MAAKIIFITGTDTGVGKTLLTALLLCHLREQGARVLALKPFCSGGRDDAELLHSLQNGDLSLDEINPFYFPEPVAPLISARIHKRRIPIERVVRHIQSIAAGVNPATSGRSSSTTQNYLLIEGSGGLLVPLGEGYTVNDLIARLDCQVIVVSRNKLGTINHTLLTVRALVEPVRLASRRASRANRLSGVVLMDSAKPDFSSQSNSALLSEFLAPSPLVHVPFLGRDMSSAAIVRKSAAKLEKTLARIVL